MRQVGPWIKNKNYTLTIQSLGFHGDGIALIDGYRIFVPGGLPGDLAEVRLIKIAQTWAAGRLMQLIAPSEDRVIPDCPVARTCGGCQLQHMAYPAQLAWKQNVITDALSAVTDLKDSIIHPIISIETPAHFRNKLQFAIGFENMTPHIGLFAQNSHRIVDISHCLVQHSMTTEILKAFRIFMAETRPSIYDETAHDGLIRHIVIRVSYSMRQAHVTMVINGDELPESNLFIEKLTTCSGVSGISLNHNTTQTDVILGPRNTLLWGTETLIEKIHDLQFEMRSDTFFQTNPHQTRRLLDTVMKYASLSPNSMVWDIYCGIGLFSLAMARACHTVIGIELSETAIALAKTNAAANQITNVQFLAGDAGNQLNDSAKSLTHPDVIIVDPPRKGCDSVVLEQLITANPDRIIYVSCNPESLARDARFLIQHGFALTDVQPIDMFAHTVHLETVACFIRSST